MSQGETDEHSTRVFEDGGFGEGYGRYAPHSMIVDGLEGWEETLRAAQEAGAQAVRRLNEQAKRQAQQARLRELSAEYRQQRKSAS